MTHLIVSGTMAEIAVHEEGGSFPVLEFIAGLDSVAQKKIMKLLQVFAEHGGIFNTEKFAHEDGPVYVLKSHQVRVYCFFLPHAAKKTLILTHGSVKKRDRANPQDIERTKKVYSSYRQ